MGTIRWIAAYMILCCSFTLKAQSQATGVPADSSARDQANVNDQQGSAESSQAASAINNNSNGNNANVNDANGSNAGQASEAPSNVPAVPQTTSSQSGSPAVLADEGGNGRDGTNNVQRATMNMAGAPADNLNLDNNSEDADAELKDRQHYSRDKRASAKRSGDMSGASGINANSRKENNAQSDQNLSSKKRKAPADKDREQKSENNSRERKKRG